MSNAEGITNRQGVYHRRATNSVSSLIRHLDFAIFKIGVSSWAFVVSSARELKTYSGGMRHVCFLAMLSVTWPAFCAEPSPTPNHVISHIPRQQVQSTAIAAVGYSKRQHILEIEFVNGAIYRYFDVPPAVYRELMSSESKARFYDSNIRRRYRSLPIRSRQKEQAAIKSPASAQDHDVPGHE